METGRVDPSAASKLDIIREEPCGDESPHEAHVFSYGPMHYQCPGERGVPAGTPAGSDSESDSCPATGEGVSVEPRPPRSQDPIRDLRYVTAELRTRGEVGLADIVEQAASVLVDAQRPSAVDIARGEELAREHGW